MRPGQRVKVLGAMMAFVGVALAVLLIRSPGIQAQNGPNNDEGSLIRIGFEIAPVHLNLEGKNPALVGLGSFIVNAQADCDGCHTSGGPPNFNYAAGHNPYFQSVQAPGKIDPATYLAGGSPFGQVGTPTGPSGYAGPNIISRNLTPDKNGRPEGGHTLEQFKTILRTGMDFDHIHPVCTAEQITAIEGGATPTCIPTSPDNLVNGDVLQVMPWPVHSHMTDHQIEAIYEYLSAIPCIDNTTSQPPDGAPNELRNDCGTAVAQANSRQVGPSDARRKARR